VVKRWFGCLAGGLLNIHDHLIKHKDIKPGNLLVHGENIIIADLGISNKFYGRSTSSGQSPGTKMYMAPEVRKGVRRGRQQDVWSLICCFIEMLSFVLGFTIHEFRRSCKRDDECCFSFYKNYNEIVAWLNILKTLTEDESLLALIDLLLSSFKLEERERPTASKLFAKLQEMPMFVGECCALPQSWKEPDHVKVSFNLSTNPQSLEPGSLSLFVVNAGRSIVDRQGFPSARASVGELLEEVNLGNIQSLRSAERKLMLYIAPVCLLRDVICMTLLI
jgi:serine/threonine protein kinase